METDPRPLLIVDDDGHYREVLARSLARRGFQVCAVGTALAALVACREQDPEYIVLDLNLAGESGLNLIAPLLAISPGARILVLTGYASIPTVVSAMKLGAAHYLAKPANTTDILRALVDDGSEAAQLPVDQHMTVRNMEWEYIRRILAEHGGNIAATARALKMHRRTLQRKLSKRRPTAS